MKHVLIPIDYSESSQELIQCAFSMYPESGMRFYIINRIQIKSRALSNENKNLAYSNGLFPLKEKLTKGQRLIEIVWKGDVIKNIQEAVIDYDIDLIILGTSSTPLINQKDITTQNKEVVSKIKTPVLLLPKMLHCNKTTEMVLLTDYRFIHRSRATSTLSQYVAKANAHLNIIQLCHKNNSLTQDQINNKSFLEDSLENISHSFHVVIDQTTNKALQLFTDIHKIDMIVLFAKHIHLTERLLFSPVKSDAINYHEHIPFLLIHE